MQKVKDCLFPDDALFDVEKDVWIRIEGGTATVGVDSVRAWLSGPLTSVTFKPVGTALERGKSLGATEGPRHFDVVRSPLSGTLLEVNLALEREPRTVNRDPYGEGWLAKIAPTDLARERSELMTFDAARTDLERRISDLKVRCFSEFPDYEMYEIGSECAGVLVKLDELMASSLKGAVVHLVSDDVTAQVELIRWSERTGQRILEARKEGSLWHFIVRKARD